MQKPDIAHLKPRFEDWALIKAQALITGKVSKKNGKSRILDDFRFHKYADLEYIFTEICVLTIF